MVKENVELRDSFFYQKVFKGGLAADFPQFFKASEYLERRLDLASDMRLYGAELESLLNQSADSQIFLPLQIDWLKTSSEKLYLDSFSAFQLTSSLDEKAQNNFAKLFLNQLFEKSIFISYWENIAKDLSGRVAMVDFDYVYPASDELKQFVLDLNRNPKNFYEMKLAYALRLLSCYCPLVDFDKLLDSYQNCVVSSTPLLSHQNGFLNQLSKQGLGFGFGEIYCPPKSQSSLIHRLLVPQTSNQAHKSENKVILFWGPAFITALILFILWRF